MPFYPIALISAQIGLKASYLLLTFLIVTKISPMGASYVSASLI